MYAIAVNLTLIDTFLFFSLNYWCKNLHDYDANNERMVKSVHLDAAIKANLANEEKRKRLCRKQDELVHSVTDCIRVVGQIANYIKLLLTKSAFFLHKMFSFFLNCLLFTL